MSGLAVQHVRLELGVRSCIRASRRLFVPWIVSLIEDDGWCLVAQPDFVKHCTSDVAVADILRGAQASGIVMGMDEEQGIYRDEVRLMMGALADIYVDTGRILAVLGHEEDGDEEEEVDS